MLDEIILAKYTKLKRKLFFDVEFEVSEIKRKLRLAKVKEMQRFNRMSKLEQMTGCQKPEALNSDQKVTICEHKSSSMFMTCPDFEQFNDDVDIHC